MISCQAVLKSYSNRPLLESWALLNRGRNRKLVLFVVWRRISGSILLKFPGDFFVQPSSGLKKNHRKPKRCPRGFSTVDAEGSGDLCGQPECRWESAWITMDAPKTIVPMFQLELFSFQMGRVEILFPFGWSGWRYVW